MNSSLNLAIAADFMLTEKLVSLVEKMQLASVTITVVETETFLEEQKIRFNGKYVEQLSFSAINRKADD